MANPTRPTARAQGLTLSVPSRELDTSTVPFCAKRSCVTESECASSLTSSSPLCTLTSTTLPSREPVATTDESRLTAMHSSGEPSWCECDHLCSTPEDVMFHSLTEPSEYPTAIWLPPDDEGTYCAQQSVSLPWRSTS